MKPRTDELFSIVTETIETVTRLGAIGAVVDWDPFDTPFVADMIFLNRQIGPADTMRLLSFLSESKADYRYDRENDSLVIVFGSGTRSFRQSNAILDLAFVGDKLTGVRLIPKAKDEDRTANNE